MVLSSSVGREGEAENMVDVGEKTKDSYQNIILISEAFSKSPLA
jgi:hypothetical protein